MKGRETLALTQQHIVLSAPSNFRFCLKDLKYRPQVCVNHRMPDPYGCNTILECVCKLQVKRVIILYKLSQSLRTVLRFVASSTKNVECC